MSTAPFGALSDQLTLLYSLSYGSFRLFVPFGG